MRPIAATLFAAAVLLTGRAQAQDVGGFQSMVGASVEGFGQSVAESLTGASSIFVTASGYAQLQSAGRPVYTLDLDGSAATAVEAVRQRDAKLKTVLGLAHQFTIQMQTGPATITRDSDRASAEESRRAALLVRLAKAGGDAPSQATPVAPPRMFIARTPLRFRPTQPEKMAPFLDAMRAAGIDDLELEKDSPAFNMFLGGLLGATASEPLPDAVWDEASRTAMAEARRQAGVLATAAGRTLGPVRQVMSMTRTAKAGQAQVVLAVRFGLEPAATSPQH